MRERKRGEHAERERERERGARGELEREERERRERGERERREKRERERWERERKTERRERGEREREREREREMIIVLCNLQANHRDKTPPPRKSTQCRWWAQTFFYYVDSVIKGNYMYYHAVIRREFQFFFLWEQKKLGGQIRREPWPRKWFLLVGTADDFSNLNVLQQNFGCRKKKLFSFPTQQILARSVKKRRSYRSSKSSGLKTNLSPSLWEKIRFDGTSGLIFHADNGSFAYTLACDRPSYHWRMHGGAKIIDQMAET